MSTEQERDAAELAEKPGGFGDAPQFRFLPDDADLSISPGGRPINYNPLSASKTDNWVARRGGLPPYVRGVARGIAKSHGGAVTSRDIAIAIARMKVWAAGGGHVHPAVRAAAAAAVARWEAMKRA